MVVRFGTQGEGAVREGKDLRTKVAVAGTLRWRTVLAASPSGVEGSILAFLPAVDISIRVQ